MLNIQDMAVEIEREVPNLSKALSAYKTEKNAANKTRCSDYIRRKSISLSESYISILRKLDILKLKIGGTIGELKRKRKGAAFDGAFIGLQGVNYGFQCKDHYESGCKGLAVVTGLLTALSAVKFVVDGIDIVDASKRINILETFLDRLEKSDKMFDIFHKVIQEAGKLADKEFEESKGW